jgi:uncharacterized protein (TIGR01777 family)
MRLVVAGGTGFIGSFLCARLLQDGHSLTVLTRSRSPAAREANRQWLTWDGVSDGPLLKSIEGADGIVNLAGEPIAARRWTAAQKEKIRSSRVGTTRALVGAISRTGAKPKFLINGSAVGYYGPRGDEIVTEETPPGTDYLSRVCVEWEAEARKAESSGVRVVCLRTGIVLGKGGALAKMVPPFKFFAGGPLGSGNQWMPWIQMEDEVGLILFSMENAGASGALNGTAPNPVTMREFCKTLGKVLHRPCWAPVPAFALKILLGEMAGMLLTGQRAVPERAQKLGYRFRYPNLYEALQASVSS